LVISTKEAGLAGTGGAVHLHCSEVGQELPLRENFLDIISLRRTLFVL
jgi:hypothetical protein